ncbi:hypothetical protein [Paraburkholderia bannensis]|uniref:hypothetical protein n=1 Tax=Paraburkholderia bannensis TaxID=765414 RepID=UPI0005A79CDF|nr:hypothetical protein [Paraburkholderia bannensis]
MPTFTRMWIERFPYEALASRDQRPEIADRDLKGSLPDGCVVAYVDEIDRTHIMEARAYGPTTGNRKLLIGYQFAGALVPEPTWKAVERYDRVFVIARDIEFPHRTIPAQFANQFTGVPVVAPETGLDLTTHEGEGY